MNIDISNFYLHTPMTQYEYLKLKLCDIPDEIIKLYSLHEKATTDGSIYVEIRKGLYGLPQEGIIANNLLEKQLEKHEYTQSNIVPILWKHTYILIQFTLVVDNFGLKNAGKEHAERLISALQEDYTITHI